MPQWFDKGGTQYISSLKDRSEIPVGYIPRKPGLFTGLGKIASGVGNAFAIPYGHGNPNYDIEQARLLQQQDEADMEFQKYLINQHRSKYIYTTDEYGKPVFIGDIGKGNQFVPPASLMSPEDKIQSAVRKSELTKSAEILPKMDQALEAFNMLKEQYNSAVTPSSVKEGDIASGLKARVAGVGKAAKAAVGASPNLQVFKNNRGAFASLISKGGFLEAGMLTNQDIERVLKAVPNEFSTMEEADKGWSTVSGILGKARQRFEKTLQSPTKESKGFDPTQLSDDELRKIINGK